jgi:hypothetical protein
MTERCGSTALIDRENQKQNGAPKDSVFSFRIRTAGSGL